MTRTYSFESCSLSINHPDVGMQAMYGAGLGNVTVSRANDITSHAVSSDLSVLISRHARRDGVIEINVLQASDANDYLNKLCNYLETCDVARFPLCTMILTSTSTGEQWICKGVTHQKMPNKAYAPEGAEVAYSFMVADLTLQQI